MGVTVEAVRMQTSVGSPVRVVISVVGVALIAVMLAAIPIQAQGTSEESTFLSLINDYRADSDRCWTGERWRSWPSDAARSLTRSTTLDQAAEDHNVAMIEKDCFSHQCAGEPDLPERVETAGYPADWRYLSENIAGGFETAQAVMDGWRNSESHNRTMLDCRTRAIGIARTNASQTPYRWYWTSDFGDVVDSNDQSSGSSNPTDPVLAKLQAYDANRNDRIDRPEFNEIVVDWNAGRLSDRTVQKAYELYRSGESLSGAGVPLMLAVTQRVDRATFVVTGPSARALNVHIYGLSGDLVYAGQTTGADLVWRLQNNQGRPVANGVYLYVIEADTARGTHRRVGRMTVLH